MLCQRKFCRGIRLKPAVALQMLRLQIGKYQCVEGDAFVSVLQGALAGHLDDRVRTARVDCAAQKLLQKKPPRHGHFVEVVLSLVSHTKTDSARGGDPYSAGAQDFGDQFYGRRFAFGPCYCDDSELPGREAV